MVSEAHCMSFPCTELLLNYAKIMTVFHSMAPLNFHFRHVKPVNVVLTCNNHNMSLPYGTK